MSLRQKLTTHLMERCGGIVDIKENPEVLDDLVNEVRAHLEAEKGSASPVSGREPFGVPWMDSWVAHHVFAERVADLQSKNREVASLLQGMIDVQFKARLGEIRDVIRGRVAAPPDGGTPEPGVPPVPPVGPARIADPPSIASEPGSPPVGPAGAGGKLPRRPSSEPGTPSPDAGGGPVGPAGRIGTPEPGEPPPAGGIRPASEPGSPPVGPAGPVRTASEPGSPPVGPAGPVLRNIDAGDEPEPPDGGPPEPGVPDPPPGPEPPAGPDTTLFADNPWILYWFISLKTPMLLEVIDLHISRRLEALKR